MRKKLPLLRVRFVTPARAPILRYGVAVLSVILALIPAFLISDLVESRLVVFAVAIMVSAWYGGWKPGLVATAFALTVSTYFILAGAQSPAEMHRSIIHLALFVFIALMICSFNAGLRSAQEALRLSESNFRSLVTNAPYGICRCDADGILLDVNPAMVAMLGYKSGFDLRGQNLANLYADSKQWFFIADFFRSKQRFNEVIADWKRNDKDNAVVTVRLSGRTIQANGSPMFFELFAEDVSEHRALEQQLRQSQKMEAIGRLAGGIAHDFNNLLMVISGYSEFLLERLGEDQSLRGPAQEIANAAQRATSLTRQLLAFSRKQMLTPKILDLNEVVSENVKMLTRLIGEDIELVMAPSSNLWPVKADLSQIEQVIVNLAVNARDAMPRGGRLTVETSNVTLDENYARLHAPAAPGDYVMIALSDTGMGMDAETQSHIFEPFFTTKGAKGTGLGLSTVYGIVKQSGGYVWVYSEPEKGTTIKIYLPRAVAEVETAVLQQSAGAAVQQARQGNETILIVEDETNLRYLAKQYLQRQGYTILEAPDGAAALNVVNSYPGPIHLLLTDVIMPGMNGRELAQHVKFMRPDIHILYMSGYTENAVGSNGTLDSGIVLLQKPFTLTALKAKVREVLDAMPRASANESAAKPHLVSSAPRSQRFKLHLPLKYRSVGDEAWRAGTTENISRSGLLFRAEEVMPVNVQIEISLVLPAEIAGLSPAEVVCRGEIVRTVEQERAGLGPALAAKILQYQFQHGGSFPQA